MAEEQKPAEVPKDAPAAEPVAETKAEEAKPAEDKPAETAEAAPAAEAAAEEAKKEVTPVEEGHLEHKKAGKFPGNILYSKQHFWFGSDALEKTGLSNLLKSADNHHNAAWASHTGKGLLFFGDKSTPTGAINLNDISEPATDGPFKFHFTSKGHKHTFRAATPADRDNWVAQLKTKMAEAKALAESIPESEAYKKAIESFKPAPPAKEEKPAEVAKEAPKEEAAKEEPAKEEAKKEEEPGKEEAKEDTKRRSASRKRASIMGFLGGKKDKKEEKKEEEATEAPKEDTPAAEAAAAAEPAPAAPATEDKPAEEAAPAEEKAAETKEAPKEKPATSKRNSFFGLLQNRGRKSESAEAAPPAPAKDGEAPATTEAAPVIPPVEATTPLAVDVASPATVPTETKEVAPATNGDTATKVKSERRKSSIPFLTKKEKSAVSDEDGEKQSTSPFSKLRATIRGRKEKAEKAAEEKAAEDKPAEEKPAVTTSEPAAEAPKQAEEPVKPEAIATTTPAVTAAA